MREDVKERDEGLCNEGSGPLDTYCRDLRYRMEQLGAMGHQW